MSESGDDGDEKDEDDINDDAGDESGVEAGGEYTIEAVEGEDGGHRGDNVADDAGGLARLRAMGLVVILVGGHPQLVAEEGQGEADGEEDEDACVGEVLVGDDPCEHAGHNALLSLNGLRFP